MVLEEFRASLHESAPAADLPPLLAALWWDANGNWSRAHEIAQEIQSKDAARVHAYLHRKEGDEWNAGYWYRQAGKPHCKSPRGEEWEAIVTALLPE